MGIPVAGLDEGGLDEAGSRGTGAPAAIDDFASLGADAIKAVHHLVDGSLVDQRTHESVGVEGIADADLAVGGLEALNKGGGDGLLQEEAADGGAALAGGADGAEQDGAEGEVKVGVRGDDDAIVAAELEDGAANAPADNLGDPVAHAAASGGADERDAAVVQQALADR
jgi:hypothetical protein